MDLLQQTKHLCKLYNIKPARSKGQNFLISEIIYDKIIKAADLQKDDVVLEVGPGLGFLTEKLAEKAKKVIAVELDDKLAETLRVGLKAKGIKNVEVVNEDILTLPLIPLLNRRGEPMRGGDELLSYLGGAGGGIDRRGELKGRGFKIVANLPYNITSVFLRKSLAAENKPSLMVLMLQKEVAERICAKQGKMNLLAVSIQFYAKPEIIQIVLADNFWPQPKVDSAIIHLTTRPPLTSPLTPLLIRRGELKDRGQRGIERGRGEKDFFRLVKIGFSAKRKMLKNNLATGYHIGQGDAEAKIVKAGFNPKIRAQALSVADWIKLLEEFKGDVV